MQANPIRRPRRVRCEVCGTLNDRAQALWDMCPPCAAVAIPCAELYRAEPIDVAFARARTIIQDPDGPEAEMFRIFQAFRAAPPPVRAILIEIVADAQPGKLAGMSEDELSALAVSLKARAESAMAAYRAEQGVQP